MLMASVAHAQIQYFQAGVPVKSQGTKERAEAAELGLYEVLQRMSGSREVEINEVIVERSRRALSYVLQFRYGELDDEVLQDKGYQSMLYLSYSPKVIKDIILEAGLNFWPVNRPNTLVWLVEDSAEFGKRLVNQASAELLSASLLQQAELRGLPLSFPLLDLQDQFTLSAEQLWDLDERAILDASERYDADVVLIGKYTTTSSGQTWANWQFIHAGDSRVFDTRVDDLSTIGAPALDPLASFLAQRYAIRVDENGAGYFSMLVHEVESYADYRGVIDALSKLDPVSRLEVDRMVNDVIYLKVHCETTAEQFADVLALGGRLLSMPSAYASDIPAWELPQAGTSQNPLLYRWVGR